MPARGDGIRPRRPRAGRALPADACPPCWTACARAAELEAETEVTGAWGVTAARLSSYRL